MAINTYLSTIESRKPTKQTRTTDRIMDMENILMVTRWDGAFEGMGEDVRGLRSINWYSQNSHGDVKYHIGNGVAKEPMHEPCT